MTTAAKERRKANHYQKQVKMMSPVLANALEVWLHRDIDITLERAASSIGLNEEQMCSRWAGSLREQVREAQLEQLKRRKFVWVARQKLHEVRYLQDVSCVPFKAVCYITGSPHIRYQWRYREGDRWRHWSYLSREGAEFLRRKFADS